MKKKLRPFSLRKLFLILVSPLLEVSKKCIALFIMKLIPDPSFLSGFL